MNDLEQRLHDALNGHVDARLGEKRPAPPFDPRRRRSAGARFARRSSWGLPLIAAASIVAVIAGTVGASHLVADDDAPASQPPAPTLSRSVQPPTETSTEPSTAAPSPSERPSRSSTSAQPRASSSGASTTRSSPPPPTPTTVVLAGARIRLPAGWTATDVTDSTSAGSGPRVVGAWCLAPGGGGDDCPVRLERLGEPRPGDVFDVDAIGQFRRGQVQLCVQTHPRERAGVRDFGGRPAEWREVFGECGKRYVQYVVATNPMFVMSSESPAAVAALGDIATKSTLPAQADPMRVFDRGYLRKAVDTPDGTLVTLDRVVEKYTDDVGGRFVDDGSAQTYTYLVPRSVWHRPAPGVDYLGSTYYVRTTGTAVYKMNPDSTWM